MPPFKNNRIRTINDGSAYNSGPASGGDDDGGTPTILKCYHIPTLPSANEAKEMLDRVVREFEPIAQRRGYNVRSVSEMCCCGDGLDHAPGKRRKRRKQSNNIWGYNMTTWWGGRQSHTIHLRLRHATDHGRFHLYEDVAGTMAHELAHCEHGRHNNKFYKLMDEILEEHAVLMASNLTRNGYTIPSFTGQGQKLGGNNGSMANARRQYRPQQKQHPGYKLGGDACFTNWMTPAEAAVVAAEARRRQQQLRLRGDRCCRPCVIEIDDEDDEDGEEEDESDNGVVDVEVVGESDALKKKVADVDNSVCGKNRILGKENSVENNGESNAEPDEDRKPAATRDNHGTDGDSIQRVKKIKRVVDHEAPPSPLVVDLVEIGEESASKQAPGNSIRKNVDEEIVPSNDGDPSEEDDTRKCPSFASVTATMVEAHVSDPTKQGVTNNVHGQAPSTVSSDDSNGTGKPIPAAPVSNDVDCIDLTISDDDGDDSTGDDNYLYVSRSRKRKWDGIVSAETAATGSIMTTWMCSKCTYRNAPSTISCTMCNGETCFL